MITVTYCILFIVGGYLVGALPVGYWLVRLVADRDIRRFGSGNIGATNVARLLGWAYFPLIFLLDAGKAWVVLMLVMRLVPYGGALLVATALLVGNGKSLFLQFGGGKGVSTAIGLFAALFSFSYAMWLVQALLIVAVIARNMAKASVLVFALLPLAHWLLGFHQDLLTVVFVAFLAMWIVLRHRSNMQLWGCDSGSGT